MDTGADSPPLRISLLGASGVGKTTFLVAAHASATGVRLTSPDPAQRDRLAGHWERLAAHGTFPPGTDVPGDWTFALHAPPGERFAVEMHDHRGGALEDTTTPAQTEFLHSRLTAADGILLVLDGGVLGERIACRTGERWDLARARSALHVGMLSGVLADVVARRRRAGRAPQSVALVVSKSDALVRAAGPDAVAALPAHLRELVPATFDPSIVTAVCPAGVHRDAGRAPSAAGFLAPFAFVALGRLASRRRELRIQINAGLGDRRAGRDEATLAAQHDLTTLRRRSELLLAELTTCPVFRGADPVTPGDLAGVANPWAVPAHPTHRGDR